MTSTKGIVLVVDDDAESRRITASILAGRGYRVHEACSGEAALTSIRADRPDLILLDSSMPAMGGAEVPCILKADEASRNIPLMSLVGSTDEDEVHSGFAPGAVDFIRKPVRSAELLARVATHLELRRLRTELENTLARRAQLRTVFQELRHEIAARRSAEHALAESEARFRNMADAAPVMIWASAPDELCTFFSRPWLSFTGRALEQALGNGWRSAVHPDDLSRHIEKYSAAHDTRDAFQDEFRLRRADGEYRWMLSTGAPRFTKDGGFAGLIGSCVDITDAKRNQDQALSAQKLQSIGLLAAGIGHDFNNMLGGIRANLDLLLEDFSAPSPILEQLQRIQSTVNRAVEIVRELMNYAGEKVTGFEVIDLVPLAGEMVELLNVSISKRARLRISCGRNLPAVRANPVQIRQVIMNLIINASEALQGDEGEILLSLTAALATAPEKPTQEWVRLMVCDTGHGMPDDVRKRIFDPFFTTKASGRGLGLSVVRGIVRAHGGSISVKTAPGNGCAFEILLPGISHQTVPERIGTGAAAGFTCGDAHSTVLLIEDEESLRQAITNLLRRRGFRVIETGDGSSAIDLFRRNQGDIDTVVLDVSLPGRSSREVLRQVRSERPEIKLVLTSAYGYETAVEAVGNQPTSEFLRKPYRLQDLVDMLNVVQPPSQLT